MYRNKRNVVQINVKFIATVCMLNVKTSFNKYKRVADSKPTTTALIPSSALNMYEKFLIFSYTGKKKNKMSAK